LAKNHTCRRAEHNDNNGPQNQEYSKIDKHVLYHFKQWAKLLGHSHAEEELDPAVAGKIG